MPGYSRAYFMATEKNLLETYFEWYLNELKEAGFIKKYKREPFPILVSESTSRKRYNFKSKVPKLESYNLFAKNTYTCDYCIIWEKRAHELFFNLLDESTLRTWCPFYAMIDKDGEYISLCDVKPPPGVMMFGNNTTGYTFPIIQKIIYNSYGIYITKTIPIPLVSKGKVKSGNTMALFTTTFVPKRYHLTDSGQQGRDIKYRKQTLQEYVSYKTKEIDRINALLSVQTKLL
jgi:hypothetical protein